MRSRSSAFGITETRDAGTPTNASSSALAPFVLVMMCDARGYIVRTSHVQPTIMSAAIQSLVNLHAAEAAPFLKYLVAQPYLDRTLMQNAINALTQLKNATPGVPGQTR